MAYTKIARGGHAGSTVTIKVNVAAADYGRLLAMQREGRHKSLSGMIRSILLEVIADEYGDGTGGGSAPNP